MEAIPLDSKNIAFMQGGERLATLSYPKRMSARAFIQPAHGEVLEIKPLDIWKSSFEVLENGKAIITFKKKWHGQTNIEVIRQGHRQSFVFKNKGFFDYRYVLADNDGREMAVLRTKFVWKGFKYNYNLQISDSLKRREDGLILVILLTYLSRYIMHQQHHGAAIA